MPFEYEDETPRGRFEFEDAAPPAKKNPSAGSRAQAAAAGVNRGFFGDLIGLPVDTITNVLDLAKAGVGYATSKVTGGTPPEWTEPFDRSHLVGSGEWNARKINEVGLGSAINNPNPDDAASRILHTGGRVAGASVVPVRSAAISLPQNAANMTKGFVGGLAAGSVGEVSPEYAGVAGMMPQLLSKVGASGVKRIVRGGEAGRQAMAQRIQDLRNGGIEEPSVGLASGNRTVMGIENLLSQTPGSVNLYATARDKNISGMRDKANSLRDSISPEYGPLVAGEAIQGSIKGSFINRFKGTQAKLYDAVDAMIPGATKAQVSKTADALLDLTAGIEGAPNIGNRFINGRISDINQGFRLDTGLQRQVGAPMTTNIGIPGIAGTPGAPARGDISVTRTIDPRAVIAGEGVPKPPSMNAQNTPRRGDSASAAPTRTTQITIPGTPAAPGVPGRAPITVSRTVDPLASVAGEGTWRPPASPTLPYQAVAKLRTQVGKELDGNMLSSDVPRAQWKQLYGALSDDIGGTAAATGPKATAAWERANGYTRKGMTRLDELGPLANRDTPESAFNAVNSSLKSGPTVYSRLRGALTTDARKKVVATIVDEMGSAAPGQQGAAGDTWSPRTFLTNYNKIDAGARTELFKRIPGGGKMTDNLADIAKTADMLDNSSKIWANPSGTAPAITARATLGALTVGAYFQPLAAAGTASGLVLANQASQRLLLNPKFVNWLAKAPRQARPEQMAAYTQRLIANAKMTNDKQFQQDVSEYVGLVEDAQQD